MAKIECKNLMFKQLTSFDYIYLVFSRLDFHLVNLKKKGLGCTPQNLDPRCWTTACWGESSGDMRNYRDTGHRKVLLINKDKNWG